MPVNTLLQRVFLVLLSATTLACESIPQHIVQHSNNESTLDLTMGTYHKNQDKELILVTMSQSAHKHLSNGQKISRQDNLPERYGHFLSDLATEFGIKRVADWPIATLGIRCFVFAHNNSNLNDDWLNDLKDNELIDDVQTLKIHQVATASYNDPLLNMQNGLKTLQASESHRWATGSGVKVAVIDTGLDTQHIELKDKTRITRDYVFQNQQSFREDIHGTAIAGVIAADANNNSGMVGVAPNADIVAIKACWQEQKNYSAAFCNTYTLSKAVNYAINIGVDIINLSLAGPPDPLLEKLLEQAMKNNIIVVGSVHPRLRHSFPTNVTGVIAVTDQTNNNSRQAERVIHAPGNKILSTGPDDKYDFFSGSSISTAHVSGVLALLRERKPHLSPQQAQEALHNSTSSQGYINACYAVSQLIRASGC